MDQLIQCQDPDNAVVGRALSDLYAEVVALPQAPGVEESSHGAERSEAGERGDESEPWDLRTPQVPKRQGHRKQKEGHDQEDRSRSDPLNQQETRDECSQDATRSRHGIESADHVTSARDILQAQLDDDRRDHTEDEARHQEQRRRQENDARGDRQSGEDVGEQVHQGQYGQARHTCSQQDDPERRRRRIAVGYHAPHVVTNADPGEHDADYAGPRVEGDADLRREDSSRDDLDDQSTGAGREYDEVWVQRSRRSSHHATPPTIARSGWVPRPRQEHVSTNVRLTPASGCCQYECPIAPGLFRPGLCPSHPHVRAEGTKSLPRGGIAGLAIPNQPINSSVYPEV